MTHPQTDFEPSELPPIYASTCKGDCLEPIIADGTCMVFERDGRPAPGDFVGLWFKPEFVPPGESTRMVKRLVMALAPGLSFPHSKEDHVGVEHLVVVEMTNPPRRMYIPAYKLLALHKCLGVAQSGPGGMASYRPAENGNFARAAVDLRERSA